MVLLGGDRGPEHVPHLLPPGSHPRRKPHPLNLCYFHDVITHGLLVTVPATDSDPTVLRARLSPTVVDPGTQGLSC